MPTDEPVVIPLPDETDPTSKPSQAEDESAFLEDSLYIPTVSEAAAMQIGLQYRLDLLNFFDRIDDAARGVNVAENNMLPDLNATGSVTWDTTPTHLNSWHFGEDRRRGGRASIWRFRSIVTPSETRYGDSLILKRRAERDYRDRARYGEAPGSTGPAPVIEQQRISVEIQQKNRDLAVFRRTAARFQFVKGTVSNREVTDADSALVESQNRLAQAQAALRLAILQFRRDAGILRIDDSGKWVPPTVSTAPLVVTTQPTS